MEFTILRRRSQTNLRIDIPLIYKLVILLRSHKEYKIVATSSSIAFRIVCLCDMAIKQIIKYGEDQKVVQTGKAETDIEREFVYKIGMIRLNAYDTAKALNGELSKAMGIKNLKNKIFKEMEVKNIIRIGKGSIFNKIVLTNLDIWNEIHLGIISECRSGGSLGCKVLLLALDYINKMESLLVLCNESDTKLLVQCLSDFKTDIRERRCKLEDQLVFDFLKVLLK